jgi:hypothetical protein
MLDRLQAAMNGTRRQEPTQEMVGFHATLVARLLRGNLRRTGPSSKPLADSEFLVGAWCCACAGGRSHVAQQSFASWVHTQATKAAAAAHTGRFVLQARMRPRDVR